MLYETGLVGKAEVIRFSTRSGELKACRHDALIELDFPATPPQEAEPPDGLIRALGVEPVWVGKSVFDYLVEVYPEQLVSDMMPDFATLAAVDCRGVMVTSRSEAGDYDFISRFFAPGYGIDEDPVTGSAHCCLGPYWRDILGKQEFLAYQASKRGGRLRVHVKDDRTLISGNAVTVLRCELIGV
jgi:PhzF family phenazine biosynthesis protein